MKKEQFLKPNVEVINFSLLDFITLSNTGGNTGGSSGGTDLGEDEF